jgi:hypothetical protein
MLLSRKEKRGDMWQISPLIDLYSDLPPNGKRNLQAYLPKVEKGLDADYRTNYYDGADREWIMD